MIVIDKISILKETLKKYNNDLIGFVPTMGALHKGHISLIEKSIKQNSFNIVSIFINPTQFLKGEDFDQYPKSKKDITICKELGVDVLFMPSINEIYINSDEILIKAPRIGGYILEGNKRAGHFDGMPRVVLKLLNIVNPTNVYFGKKDAQQLMLVDKMIKELFLDVNIVACDIIRDHDGLALSSRNSYLSKAQRKEALKISASLFLAQKLINEGQNKVDNLILSMKKILKNIDIEYIKVVNRDFEQLKIIEQNNSIILIAVKIGKTRLIDNIWV